MKEKDEQINLLLFWNNSQLFEGKERQSLDVKREKIIYRLG